MKRFVLLFLLAIAPARLAWAEQLLAPATIVVFNSAIPESVELAKFYAQKRGITRDHLVGLACSREEEISRQDYDRTIAKPLREVFRQRKWWTVLGPDGDLPTVSENSIRFIALIKGIPMKIKPAEEYPGDKSGPGPIGNRNEASVDSETVGADTLRPANFRSGDEPLLPELSSGDRDARHAAHVGLPAGCADRGDRSANDH